MYLTQTNDVQGKKKTHIASLIYETNYFYNLKAVKT